LLNHEAAPGWLCVCRPAKYTAPIGGRPETSKKIISKKLKPCLVAQAPGHFRKRPVMEENYIVLAQATAQPALLILD
jgi:hypothetical protein